VVIVEDNICFECGFKGELHQHHVVPQVLGGTRTIPLCTSCHSKVHSKDLTKFSRLAKIGRKKAMERGVKMGRKMGSCETEEDFLKKDRTKKIISLLGDGKSVREISSILGVSTKTVVKTRKKVL